MVKDYNKSAETYSQTVDLFNLLDDWVYLNNLPEERKRVLDIGCGTGSLLKAVGKRFDKLYGIDNSSGMLKIAKNIFPAGHFVIGTGEKLPFSDVYFDMVMCHASFHYMNRDKAVDEAVRVLKKSGKLIIVEPVHGWTLIDRIAEMIVYRYLFTIPRMVLKFGINRTFRAWKFINSEDWKGLIRHTFDNFLTIDQFNRYYSQKFPEAKMGIANFGLRYVVWRK